MKSRVNPFRHLLLLLILACPCSLFAEDGYYLNPGIKFGYTFGENGGATVGIEVSYTRVGETSDRPFAYGILASVDYCKNADRVRYHIGGEYLFLAIGPTMIVEAGAIDWGVNVTPYLWAIVVPYFNYTFRTAGHSNLSEVGGFLKIPIWVKGDEYSFSGD